MAARVCPTRFDPCAPTRAHVGALRALRLQRGHVGGDGDHVVAVELLDHALHQRGRGAAALAGLEVVDLARDVARRAARNARYVAEALEALPVADRARQRLAATGRDERLAFGEAAGRYVGDEARMRAAQLDLLLVLRQF